MQDGDPEVLGRGLEVMSESGFRKRASLQGETGQSPDLDLGHLL